MFVICQTPFTTGIQRWKHEQPKVVATQVDKTIIETRPENISQEIAKEEPRTEPIAAEKSLPKPKPSSWAALLKSPNNVTKPATPSPATQQIVNNQSDKPAVQPLVPKFTGIAGT